MNHDRHDNNADGTRRNLPRALRRPSATDLDDEPPYDDTPVNMSAHYRPRRSEREERSPAAHNRTASNVAKQAAVVAPPPVDPVRQSLDHRKRLTEEEKTKIEKAPLTRRIIAEHESEYPQRAAVREMQPFSVEQLEAQKEAMRASLKTLYTIREKAGLRPLAAADAGAGAAADSGSSDQLDRAREDLAGADALNDEDGDKSDKSADDLLNKHGQVVAGPQPTPQDDQAEARALRDEMLARIKSVEAQRLEIVLDVHAVGVQSREGGAQSALRIEAAWSQGSAKPQQKSFHIESTQPDCASDPFPAMATDAERQALHDQIIDWAMHATPEGLTGARAFIDWLDEKMPSLLRWSGEGPPLGYFLKAFHNAARSGASADGSAFESFDAWTQRQGVIGSAGKPVGRLQNGSLLNGFFTLLDVPRLPSGSPNSVKLAHALATAKLDAEFPPSAYECPRAMRLLRLNNWIAERKLANSNERNR